MAERNSAAGKVSSPDHINASSKKVFGGARKSATRNACAMHYHNIQIYLHVRLPSRLDNALFSYSICVKKHVHSCVCEPEAETNT